jgi:23S rRNA (guanine2445-N2)-methyltransferase / 23S rRNA (guanine2069-N7)-methyltransferase
MQPEHHAFISCPKGIESLLIEELEQLNGFVFVKQRVGGVFGRATLTTLYRVCLWSRLANRVLLQLAESTIDSRDALRDWLLTLDWDAHLSADQSLHIRFFGELPGITHTQFGAQYVKDAIVDWFRERGGERPSVDRERPDLRFQLNVEKRHATLYLDLSGDSLHQRGYRTGVTAAPLKENLAAALLIRAQWPRIAAEGGALIDPMCGSGTFLTEAALIAADIAPGLLRERFGFTNWRQHDADGWRQLLDEARARRKHNLPPILGYDHDKRALGVADQHIAALALGDDAPDVYVKTLADWKKPTHRHLKPGLLIANPPYGVRLGQNEQPEKLVSYYELLGRKWVEECPDWQAALITADEMLVKATRLYWSRQYTFFNGAIECRFYLFDLQRGLKEPLPTQQQLIDNVDVDAFAQRLHKNRKRLAGWLKQQNIDCYRLYYADIPEFAVAVDIYHDWAVVQEYQAPKTVDPQKAELRLQAALRAIPVALNLPHEHVVLKHRQRQKGSAQYEKLGEQRQLMEVREGNARLLVDLNSYLDTGLFLDHRPVRLKLAKLCAGKRLLNLFCYTAAATVHAALGGATNSLSVDLSNTYLDWAERNFKLNQLDMRKHTLLRADVLTWLNDHREQYDVIFLDPPTFSNSKSMETVLDIQRDHGEMIDQAMRCLAKDGVLIFSTNFRKFKLDPAVAERYNVNNITDWSIPRDFQRPAKIHYCFEIKHRL